MNNIKMMALAGTLTFTLSGAMSFAEESKPSDTTAAQPANTTKTEKKSRKKKATMCQECGKPETECECHGKEHEGHADKK